MIWHPLRKAALAALALSPALSRCHDGGERRNAFPRATEGKGFLSIPIDTVDRPAGASLRPRDPHEVRLDNMDFFYAMKISLGTPPQDVTVLVDTGSSELWVNPQCSSAGTRAQANQCLNFGQYQPARSRTPPTGPFGGKTIRYGDSTDPSTHTSASIVYYADALAMGTARIPNQTFGVVVASEGQSQGILGIAPDTRAGFAKGLPYSLVLNSLADEGVINSRVFSLDLRHAASLTGAIVYGGVDRSKFAGPLTSVPLADGQAGEPRLGATMTGVSFTNAEGVTDVYELLEEDRNVMLDSGTTLTRLHQPIAFSILRDLAAEQDADGYYVARCALRQSAATLDFAFGDALVRVPLSDFILDLRAASSTLCYVGLVVTRGQQIMGDSFLRAGYFVFDWDNQNVHIAQAANCGADIVAVGSGTGSVPSMTGNCASTGPAVTRTTRLTRPTAAITTTYTVSTCPLFDFECRTGVLTTQTILPDATGGITVTETAGAAATGNPNGAASALSPGLARLGLLLAGTLAIMSALM